MNNLWKVAWTHVAWVSILSEKQFLTESVKKCSWWCCLMTRQRVGCGQTQRRSLWEVSTEWGVLTPGRGTKCHVRLQGVPGIQRWESHGVVCSQGCALIFTLQTISLISPEGCPSLLTHPIQSIITRARKVGSGHANRFTSWPFHPPLCEAKLFKTQWPLVSNQFSLCKSRLARA